MPNQHGAWAMLAAPLLVGVLASGPAWVHVPLTAFWFSSYLAFFATGLWLKSRRRSRWFPPVRAYALLAASLGVVVMVAAPDLLRWLPGFVPPLAVGLWASAHRRDRDLLVGLTTVLAAGLMTVVAYDAGTSGPLSRGWHLGLVMLLYFAGTVFYVKSAIRERGNRGFHALSIGFHVLATAVTAWLSWWLVAVFVVLTVRAAFVPALRPSPRSLGIGEIVATAGVVAVSLLVV